MASAGFVAPKKMLRIECYGAFFIIAWIPGAAVCLCHGPGIHHACIRRASGLTHGYGQSHALICLDTASVEIP